MQYAERLNPKQQLNLKMSNGSTARTPFMAVLGSLSDTEKNRIIAVHFYANIPPVSPQIVVWPSPNPVKT